MTDQERSRGLDGLARQLFDIEYYCSQLPRNVVPDDPWAHYLEIGHRGGFEPSPYFSTEYFRGRGKSAGTRTAWEEFFEVWDELGDSLPAHPFFDLDYYRTTNPEIGSEHPWLHWVLHGDRDSRSPSRHFDADYYRITHLALGATCPFRHYVTHGQARGHLTAPSPQLQQESARAMQSALSGRGIVVLGNDAQLAGGPMHAEMVVRGLRDRGYSPVVVLDRGGPRLGRFEQLATTFVLRDGWDWSAMAAQLGTDTPVIGNTVVTAPLLRELPPGTPATLLVHEYPSEIERLGLTAAVRATLERGIAHSFVFPETRDVFATTLGLEREDPRLRVIGAAPYEGSPQPADYELARTALGVDTRPIVAGAGYADHRKGFDRFLKVGSEVVRRAPDVRLVWFGARNEWAEDLAASAQSNGLMIELPGEVTPLRAWLAQCSVLLVTSRSDTGPATVLYAAQEGVPTVAFDGEVGALPYVRQAGAVVPADAIDECADALMSAIEPDPHRSGIISRLVADFGTDAYLDRLLAVTTPPA